MSVFAKFNEWNQSRRDRKARQLPDAHTDIIKLHKLGIVVAKGTGQSITDIHASITSRVRVPVKVLIKHGTYFVSSGSHQNMVTRREFMFELSPQDTRNITVPASCINASRPIPGGSDSFKGVARVSDTLSRFLEAAEGEDAMTVQAGAWAITDGYSASQIQRHLRVRRSVTPGSLGSFSGGHTDLYSEDAGSAISAAHIARASPEYS